MHYPTPDIYVEFEINRCVSYIVQLRSKDISTDDGRTDIVNDDIR